MTAPAHESGTDRSWPVHDRDPFLGPQRIPESVDPATVSRFGDLQWNMSPLATNAHQVHDRVNWALFAPPLRLSFRRAGWLLVNLPTPDTLLQDRTARRRKWLHPNSMTDTVGQWARLADWLGARDITELAAMTVEDLVDYAVHVRGCATSTPTAANRLAAVTLLWGFAAHLPPCDRIPEPPWHGGRMRDYLPRTETGNENGRAPIHPAVMSPLLIWAMRFVDDLSDDILTAWQEHRALLDRVRRFADPAATHRLRELIERYAVENRPLPGSIRAGRLAPATTYLAGRTNASKEQVAHAVRHHGSDLPIADQTPLDTPIRGLVDGRAWLPHITFHEAPRLMRMLSTACMIVIAYLTGMRTGEVLELRAGCCPEPDHDALPRRYRIQSNYFKGAHDAEGKYMLGGAPRQTPWTVIAPVVRAVRVLERMADGEFLFPVKTTWACRTDGSRKRRGEVLADHGANSRLVGFTAWVNDYAAGRCPEQRIPDDPHGPLNLSRFRRTLAWHIAHQPGGRVALAVQYGHLRASTVTDGYAGRARDGLARVLDIETARAMADYLDTLAERLDDGEHLSGPAAHRLAEAAGYARTRFAGMYLTPSQAKALLADPRLQVYDNPEAFLTCNYDPTKALCHRDRGAAEQHSRSPAPDRCDRACANIARTDTHITAVRAEIARLDTEATDPATPIPMQHRLRQRITQLAAIAEHHDPTPHRGGQP